MNMCKFTLRGECLVQIPSTDVATLNILLFLFIQNHYCAYSERALSVNVELSRARNGVRIFKFSHRFQLLPVPRKSWILKHELR